MYFLFKLLTIFNRGRIGFYSGEPRLLFEDAKMLKPTLWTTVPRILLRIYEGVQKKIGNSAFRKALLNRAVGAKIKNVDAQVFSYLIQVDKIMAVNAYLDDVYLFFHAKCKSIQPSCIRTF